MALIVAAVGMLGTLTSPVITQRLSERSRRTDSEAQRQEAMLAEKKATYVAFNATARRYTLELVNYLNALGVRTPSEAERSELDNARRAYSAALSEMQIVAPDSVLIATMDMTSQLAAAFDGVKKLELGVANPGWSQIETQEKLSNLWDLWSPLRHLIRVDLGLSSVAGGHSTPPSP